MKKITKKILSFATAVAICAGMVVMPTMVQADTTPVNVALKSNNRFVRTISPSHPNAAASALAWNDNNIGANWTDGKTLRLVYTDTAANANNTNILDGATQNRTMIAAVMDLGYQFDISSIVWKAPTGTAMAMKNVELWGSNDPKILTSDWDSDTVEKTSIYKFDKNKASNNGNAIAKESTVNFVFDSSIDTTDDTDWTSDFTDDDRGARADKSEDTIKIAAKETAAKYRYIVMTKRTTAAYTDLVCGEMEVYGTKVENTDSNVALKTNNSKVQCYSPEITDTTELGYINDGNNTNTFHTAANKPQNLSFCVDLGDIYDISRINLNARDIETQDIAKKEAMQFVEIYGSNDPLCMTTEWRSAHLTPIYIMNKTMDSNSGNGIPHGDSFVFEFDEAYKETDASDYTEDLKQGTKRPIGDTYFRIADSGKFRYIIVGKFHTSSDTKVNLDIAEVEVYGELANLPAAPDTTGCVNIGDTDSHVENGMGFWSTTYSSATEIAKLATIADGKMQSAPLIQTTDTSKPNDATDAKPLYDSTKCVNVTVDLGEEYSVQKLVLKGRSGTTDSGMSNCRVYVSNDPQTMVDWNTAAMTLIKDFSAMATNNGNYLPGGGSIGINFYGDIWDATGYSIDRAGISATKHTHANDVDITVPESLNSFRYVVIVRTSGKYESADLGITDLEVWAKPQAAVEYDDNSKIAKAKVVGTAEKAKTLYCAQYGDDGRLISVETVDLGDKKVGVGATEMITQAEGAAKAKLMLWDSDIKALTTVKKIDF